MAVVPRKRKGRVVYGVSNEWKGKPAWELVGPNKREAEQRDRAMKKEIADGTYQPPATAKALTVKQEAELWSVPRTNANANEERRMLRLYLYSRPWLCDMRADEMRPSPHTDRLVTELKAQKKANGDPLSHKTIDNFLAVMRQVYKAAIRAGRCTVQPIQLEPGTLDTSREEEPEIYEPAEVVVLTRNVGIPWPIRMLNGLCSLGGLREGESIGAKFGEIDLTTQPLKALVVRRQYEGRKLKTKRPRVVPLHPELWKLLEAWATEGFELYMGRKPTKDDFIVPNNSSRSKHPHHTRSSYYKQFVKHAEAVGVRPRSLHSTRHTFISLCRRAGANKFDLERVTHNAAGDMIDRYTHGVWIPLCEAVLHLNLDAHRDLPPGSGIPGNSGSAPGEHIDVNATRLLDSAASTLGSIPGASTSDQYQNGSLKNSRQDFRQEYGGHKGEEQSFADGLASANRRRKRRLLSYQECSPSDAKPGLALTRGLDALYAGDLKAVVGEVADAAHAKGYITTETRRRFKKGGR